MGCIGYFEYAHCIRNKLDFFIISRENTEGW